MRSSAECLGMVEDMQTKSRGCEKPADRAAYDKLAHAWGEVAKMAYLQDKWSVTPLAPFKI